VRTLSTWGLALTLLMLPLAAAAGAVPDSSAVAAPAAVPVDSLGLPLPGVTGLPLLLDLGAAKCIPCKMMMPVLDGLTKDYAGRLDVLFVDIRENRAAGPRFGVRVMPTQIFYDAAGEELWRHEGFIPREEILAKWRELGVALEG